MAQSQNRGARHQKRRAPPQKERRLEFVQDFIPLKEIKNGIIETSDGRYIKILEIEPINFLLRSNEEQWGIISTFASWLKISPMRLQFKSVTRRADSDKYIAGLKEDLKQEEVAACRTLGEGTIRFIREEGSREALSRRFFLIFQYEAASRRQVDADYSEIYAALQTAAQNARTYFAQCGNSIVQPKDEDTFVAEVLYMYFNRRSCVDDPFQNRLNRVVVDAMTAKKRVIGVDPVPRIRAVNFVAPRGLDLTHAGYIVMDGSYYTYLYIRKNGFPQQVRGGWMSSLINAGEGVDIDLHLRREIRGKTIDRVAQRIRLNRTKLRELQDTSTDYEELAGSIQAGYYIKQGLSSRNEDLFYILDYKSNHSPPPEPEIVQAEPAAAEETQSKANPPKSDDPGAATPPAQDTQKKGTPKSDDAQHQPAPPEEASAPPAPPQDQKTPKKPARRPKTLYESSRPPMDF